MIPRTIAQKPYFSVIITCYNYENYIERSILSALNQSYDKFEVIVVDDGSTDNSWEIISRYTNKVKAISTENEGFIKACTKGLSLSSGTHIIFLDADDELMPNALSKVAQKCSDPDVTKVQFMMQPIDQSGAKIGPAFPNLNASEASEIFIKNINNFGCYATPPTSGNVYRSDVYQCLGDISYDYGIDGVAYLLAPFKGKVYHLSDVLANYRIHDKNMSTSEISDQKLLRNASVFLNRLRHLEQLLKDQKIPSRDFKSRSDYVYTIECNLLAAVLTNSESKFMLFRRYCKALKPHMDRKNLFLVAFYLLAVASPHFIAQKLLIWRMNQNRMSRIRTLLKNILTSRKNFSPV